MSTIPACHILFRTNEFSLYIFYWERIYWIPELYFDFPSNFLKGKEEVQFIIEISKFYN